MTVTGPAITLQVRDDDKVLEPYRRSRLLRGHLQQPQKPRVLRPQPCQFSLNNCRDLSHDDTLSATDHTGHARQERAGANGGITQPDVQHAPRQEGTRSVGDPPAFCMQHSNMRLRFAQVRP
jgi:hypothetical protein